ncbi:MAG TPA: peptidoglycan DD-metalloendopeptidase family protein [bacterium]|nr:peptidoglycan DD-metalloendopeptidase family protein [bacterium]
MNRSYWMRLCHWKLVPIILVLLAVIAMAEDPGERFKVVMDRLVDAINREDYPRIQQDFNKEMLDAFPLSASEPFFKDLTARCGKIKSVAAPRLVAPGTAIFQTHFDGAVFDVKLVLDDRDKIAGLWLLAPTSQIPAPEEHTTVLKLPFEGQWLVLWGGDTKELNQHHDVPNQMYAFDFVRVDSAGNSFKGQGTQNEDYLAFGQAVLSPADGIVTDVIQGVRDNVPGSMNPFSALGNAVFIKHRDYEVSVLAHFKQNSICVKVGDEVKQGQLLGLCGNSGNSSEPHIHYHLQNTPIIQDGTGIKCVFSGVEVSRDSKTRTEERYSPIKGDIVANK